jgi:hypothetical protein
LQTPEPSPSGFPEVIAAAFPTVQFAILFEDRFVTI